MAAVPSTVSVCVVLLRAQGRCVNLVKKSAHRHKIYRLYAPRRNNGQVSARPIQVRTSLVKASASSTSLA